MKKIDVSKLPKYGSILPYTDKDGNVFVPVETCFQPMGDIEVKDRNGNTIAVLKSNSEVPE